MSKLWVGAVVALIAGASACTGEDDGAPGSGGSGASGGYPMGNAGKVNGGSSGEPALGGSPGAEGGMDAEGGMPTGGTGFGGTGAMPHGGSSSPAGGEGGVPTTPVNGAVLGVVKVGRAPLAGVAVVVDDQTTLTDADGEFAFADVGASYQVTLISAAAKVALILDGMTGRTPEIQFPVAPTFARTTTVDGFARSDVFKSPVWVTQVFFVSDEQELLASGATWNSSFNLSAGWHGSASVHGTLWAIARNMIGGTPWWGAAASKELTLQAGEPIEIVEPEPQGTAGHGGEPPTEGPDPTSPADLALTALASERALKCSVTAPEGFATEVRLTVGPVVQVSYENPSAPVTLRAPVGVGLPMAVSAFAFDNSSSAFSRVTKPLPASGDMSFAIQAMAKPVLPIPNATGVTTTTEFSFTTPPDDTVARVTFTIAGWSIHRLTGEQKTTLPDLSGYGVGIPKGSKGTWSISARGPAKSVDEVASLISPASSRELSSLGAEWSYSTNGTGPAFTTAP